MFNPFSANNWNGDLLHWKLTGHIRFRKTLFGKYVLQVEVMDEEWAGQPRHEWKISWRDATQRDIDELELQKFERG